jgi:hypothetical protein
MDELCSVRVLSSFGEQRRRDSYAECGLGNSSPCGMESSHTLFAKRRSEIRLGGSPERQIQSARQCLLGEAKLAVAKSVPEQNELRIYNLPVIVHGATRYLSLNLQRGEQLAVITFRH